MGSERLPENFVLTFFRLGRKTVTSVNRLFPSLYYTLQGMANNSYQGVLQQGEYALRKKIKIRGQAEPSHTNLRDWQGMAGILMESFESWTPLGP